MWACYVYGHYLYWAILYLFFLFRKELLEGAFLAYEVQVQGRFTSMSVEYFIAPITLLTNTEGLKGRESEVYLH